ncbi:MAG: chromate transporter [Clostridia bacterium]|nr:chromate transporter [Clostridia bacterium]
MIYLELFLTFLKIGAFTFGGGYAMLPLIQEEVVAHKWLSLDEMIDFIAVSESTPGPFAVNISTYVGAETAGFFGAVCATMGIVLPSFVIILIVAKFFIAFQQNRAVKGIMVGLKPAVIGLIGSAVVGLISTVFLSNGINIEVISSPRFLSSLVILLGMIILIFKKVSPIIIILISAVLGILSGYIFNL